MTYRFDVVTIFPDMVQNALNASILKRAQTKKIITVHYTNPRNFTRDKHRTVDDTTYGGGPGMVMKVEPLVRALRSIRKRKHHRVILLSARGQRLAQSSLRQYAKKYTHVILVAGHYEGVDDRIRHYVDEELSIGDYILTGGELPAMIVIDGITRLLPNVLGHEESLQEESHDMPGYIEYPHFTRPEIFEGHSVPDVLRSGDHKRIAQWRKKHSHNKIN